MCNDTSSVQRIGVWGVSMGFWCDVRARVETTAGMDLNAAGVGVRGYGCLVDEVGEVGEGRYMYVYICICVCVHDYG